MNTEAEYRASHREAIAKGRSVYPNLEWRDPWVYAGLQPPVFVSGGMWQLRCVTPGCNNCPSVSPEWRLALCWDCGAIYERLEMPAFAEAIERILVMRPRLANRNWFPGESIYDIGLENVEHGLVVEVE